MMQTTDAELLGAFFANEDDNAFRQIVERHSPMVHRVCLSGLNGDEALAKDATQSVFVLLVRKGRSLRKRQALAAWLRKTTGSVVKNLVREHSRRRKREQTAAELQAVETEEPPIGESREKLLLKEIEQLPEKYRVPLTLHYLDGRKLREVGEELGCSEDAARKRVKSSLQKLRKAMAESGAILSLAVIVGLLGKLVGAGRDEAIVQASFQAAMEAAGHAPGSLESLTSHLMAQGVESMWLQQRIQAAAAVASVAMVAVILLAINRPWLAPPRAIDPNHVDNTTPSTPDQGGAVDGAGTTKVPPTTNPVSKPDDGMLAMDDFKDASGWIGYKGTMSGGKGVRPTDTVNLEVTDIEFKERTISALDIDCRKYNARVLMIVRKEMIIAGDYQIDYDVNLQGYYQGMQQRGFSLGGIQKLKGARSPARRAKYNPDFSWQRVMKPGQWFHVRITVNIVDTPPPLPTEEFGSQVATRYQTFVNDTLFHTAYIYDVTSTNLVPIITAGSKVRMANFRVKRIHPLPFSERKLP